jgi:hypothetical protein
VAGVRWRGVLALASIAIVVAAGADAAVVQEDGIRVTVLSQVMPFKLPRLRPAPILPTCPLQQVKTATSDRALALCGDALIGSGRFWASIVLPDQRPYPTRGRLLIFNGRERGKQMLFAHIFTSSPFPTSFVIAFAIRRIHKGQYGTELSASFPAALGSWGFVDRIKLTLKRKYRYGGRALSYFNAACPALPGVTFTDFPLADVSFYFSARKPISLEINKSCRVAD